MRMYLFLGVLSFSISCKGQSSGPGCLNHIKSSFSGLEVGKVIDMTSDNCAEWDTLMVIPPEFSRSYVEKLTKVKLPKGIDFNMVLDGNGKGWWLAFLNKSEVIGHLLINRRDAEFDSLMKQTKQFEVVMIPKTKAKFISVDAGKKFSDGEGIVDINLVD